MLRERMLVLVVVLLLLHGTISHCPCCSTGRNRCILDPGKRIDLVQEIEVWLVSFVHGKLLVSLWEPTHVLLKVRLSTEKELSRIMTKKAADVRFAIRTCVVRYLYFRAYIPRDSKILYRHQSSPCESSMRSPIG